MQLRYSFATGVPIVLACLLMGACRSTTPVTVCGDQTVTFRAEVASSHAFRMKGLMFRNELSRDEGMLFVFPEEEMRSFWMLHTRVPLDMIFINEQKRIVNIEEADPCRSTPCRRYASRGRVRYVLEINQGLSRQYGFRQGVPVEFDY